MYVRTFRYLLRNLIFVFGENILGASKFDVVLNCRIMSEPILEGTNIRIFQY